MARTSATSRARRAATLAFAVGAIHGGLLLPHIWLGSEGLAPAHVVGVVARSARRPTARSSRRGRLLTTHWHYSVIDQDIVDLLDIQVNVIMVMLVVMARLSAMAAAGDPLLLLPLRLALRSPRGALVVFILGRPAARALAILKTTAIRMVVVLVAHNCRLRP